MSHSWDTDNSKCNTALAAPRLMFRKAPSNTGNIGSILADCSAAHVRHLPSIICVCASRTDCGGVIGAICRVKCPGLTRRSRFLGVAHTRVIITAPTTYTITTVPASAFLNIGYFPTPTLSNAPLTVGRGLQHKKPGFWCGLATDRTKPCCTTVQRYSWTNGRAGMPQQAPCFCHNRTRSSQATREGAGGVWMLVGAVGFDGELQHRGGAVRGLRAS
ncbi:hypothetical protein B0H67DRAFT_572990 [Lasiosphaeris hirsuta]|uniref:Uncharacterized protein n=1 Tax=Lasiosphaeris hirsuta TaxID=260670 RepID=A0AA40AP79_9PEZI|nr:hypothetical protein B0H67DRAFT_572990 [Lasiosphaeris hirsuta]